jgi:hypothetical protein
MEEKYWELREGWERAEDRYKGAPTSSNFCKMIDAEWNFKEFCTKVLEKLMDENSDVLTRLKMD